MLISVFFYLLYKEYIYILVLMSSFQKNIDEKNEYDKQIFEKEKLHKEIEDAKNNFYLKVSLINVDSQFRNKVPKNIIDSDPIYLINNPLIIKENSQEVKIFSKNNNFNVGDNFILQNINSNTLILKDCLILVKGFNYLLININNHNLNTKIYINNYDKLDKSKRLIGNIPINFILGYLNTHVYKNILIDLEIEQNILSYLNINIDDLKKNYLFFLLPFSYSPINRLNNSLLFSDIYVLDNIFEIKFQDIGGIEVQYLNANYPINNNQYQSYHIVSKVENNYIYFNSKMEAKYDQIGGGNNIYIGKVLNEINGFTNSNSYTIDLKKSFTNVVRMELISTEIPYVEFNINNNVTNKNNKLYWQYLEDGDYIYSISLPSGSYGPDNIITKLKEEMNSILRIESSNNLKIYNSFDIIIDKSSQEVQFKAFKIKKLPNSLKIIKDDILKDIYILQINVGNNYVKEGDKIIISSSNPIGDIKTSVINNEHVVYKVDTFNDIISVIIPIDLSKDNFNILGNGGSYVTVKIPDLARFLFNYNDTLGKLLGFKNVRDINSITNFNHITSNLDNYIRKIPFDEVGNTYNNDVLLNLTSSYFYIFMYLNDYEGIISNTTVKNPFAKILLVGYTGDIMYNTFVSSPLEFDIPISLINELKVEFLYPDGNKPEFLNFDHSFTLRITEKISEPVRTRENSKEKTFNQSLIEKHFLDNKN